MIKVSQKCETLEEGIKFMMAGAKADYVRMSTSDGRKELTGYSLEQTGKWDSNTKVSHGKKYIKVVQENGVVAFIVKGLNEVTSSDCCGYLLTASVTSALPASF